MVVTLAGSKDSTLPALATIIRLELFLDTQENCVKENRKIKKDKTNLLCIMNFATKNYSEKSLEQKTCIVI